MKKSGGFPHLPSDCAEAIKLPSIEFCFGYPIAFADFLGFQLTPMDLRKYTLIGNTFTKQFQYVTYGEKIKHYAPSFLIHTLPNL